MEPKEPKEHAILFLQIPPKNPSQIVSVSEVHVFHFFCACRKSLTGISLENVAVLPFTFTSYF